MLDRTARDKMVEAIEAYMNDEIMAFEFDDRLCEISAKCEDQAVDEAARSLWYFYDDLTDHSIVATREQWNFMYRIILFLQSDAELERHLSRRWSVTQIAALLMLLFLPALAWIFGGTVLFWTAWLAMGITAWEIDRRIRAPYRKRMVDAEIDIRAYPFNTNLEIFRAAKSVPDFYKKPFPKELADRRIRNGWFWRILETEIHFPSFITMPLAFLGWLIVLPFVLLGQMFPICDYRRTIHFPTA